MKKSTIYRNISIGLFMSSFVAGFIAAYINDFLPELKGFYGLFLAKAILGTAFSIGAFVAYMDTKKEMRP